MENVLNVSFSDIVKNRGEFPHIMRSDKNNVLLEINGYDRSKIQAHKNSRPHEEYVVRNCDMGFVCCLLQGRVDMEINRRLYTLSSEGFFVLLKGDCFKLLDASEDIKLFMMISDSGEQLFKVANTMTLLSLRDKLEQNRCYGMFPTTAKALTLLYALMCDSFDDENFLNKEAAVQGYMQIMFYYLSSDLIRGEKIQPISSLSRREELLSKFIRLVAENFKEQRKVKFYADKMCLTPKYLSTIVHEEGGKYARDIIAEFVIMEAKRLLMNTTNTVQEIGDELHFSCQSFFGKYFREHTGMTPQEYRQSQR